MKAYTIRDPKGLVHHGIPLQGDVIDLGFYTGTNLRARLHLSNPRKTEGGAELAGLEGPGALVLLHSQGARWELREAHSAQWWDQLYAVVTLPNSLDRILGTEALFHHLPDRPPSAWCPVIHSWTTASDAPTIYSELGVLQAGKAVEWFDPSGCAALRLELEHGELFVTDPLAGAKGRGPSRAEVCTLT